MSRQTDEAYYNIGMNWVPEAFEIVKSADAFYDLLRRTPHYIPRRIARTVWFDYGEQTGWQAFVARRNPDLPLLRRFFSDVDSVSDNPYNVKIHYTGIDKETGNVIDDWKVIGFDYMPTQSEIENLTMSDLDYKTPDCEPDTVTWSAEFYYHRQDMPW